MTRSGVEHDLKITPYRETIQYEGKVITYCFSSQISRDGFMDKIVSNRETLKNSLKNRFKMKFYLSDDFCDIQLYKRSERRGYLIIINGVDVKWSASLEYNGQGVCLVN